AAANQKAMGKGFVLGDRRLEAKRLFAEKAALKKELEEIKCPSIELSPFAHLVDDAQMSTEIPRFDTSAPRSDKNKAECVGKILNIRRRLHPKPLASSIAGGVATVMMGP